MGSAFAGIADDPSAIYYNPAGLAFFEKDTCLAQMYSVCIFSNFSYKTHTKRDISDDLLTNPGFFIAKRFDKWAFGYGYYIPTAGGGADFENFQRDRYDISGFEAYMANTFSTAYRLSPKLSLGGSLSAYYGILESTSFQFAEIETEYNGLAGYGANAGVLYKPNDRFSMGLMVKSRTSIDLDGEVKVRKNKFDIPEGDSKMELKLPYYISLGFGFVPRPDITLGFEINFMDWSYTEKRRFITDGEVFDIPTHYKDGWRLSLGLDYRINEKLSFMSGIKYTNGCTKDKGLDVSNDTTILVAPSCNVDLVSYDLGISYSITDSVTLNLTGFYVHGKKIRYKGKRYKQKHDTLLLGVDFKL